ncbi:hypothetical protein [Methanocella sp. MCL-LM]|uniref:hypothetical protein n=1 Tax=Methanocella sp. MCL-LM TaxID=3412035 RepID=UPI003C785377
MPTEEYLKGYVEGFKEALATVGQDLQDHEMEDYTVENYGELYQNIARQMGNCVVCKDIGTEKGCPAGKTIWCPRIMETMADEMAMTSKEKLLSLPDNNQPES